MSFVSADLIGLDVHPLVQARDWTAPRAARTLESIASAARSIGLADVWGRASLVGIDTSVDPATARLGATLDRAPFAGIGFSRDEDLRQQYPRSVDIAFGPEDALPPGAERLRARLREVLIPHLQEFSLVLNVALAAREERSLPVCARVNIMAGERYDFVEAHRRRMAYALGYAASLDVASLAPYEDREGALLRGTFDALVRACDRLSGPPGLSVYANLLAKLSTALTSLGTPKRGAELPSPRGVPESARKEAWLEERTHEAAAALRGDLHEDGRAALAGFLVELDDVRRHMRYRGGAYWRWGTMGTRADFGLTGSPPP